MNNINRTLLIVIPKKPYLDWVKIFDNIQVDAEQYSAYSKLKLQKTNPESDLSKVIPDPSLINPDVLTTCSSS
jgi:hypothetical protein